MTVFIVETDPTASDYYRVGVYSTLKKAQEVLSEQEDDWLGISHLELED
jgi:hypothetical protein